MTTDEVGTVVAAGVKTVDWGWRHASRKDFALRHVDFEIKPGERVLLLGASGAGKSTLMAGLAGVLGGDDEGEQEGSLLIDGQLSFYDFLAHFDMEDLYNDYNYNTLSGLILEKLEHIPHTGEKLSWRNFDFEIVDMDGARIDKVLVTLKRLEEADV